MKKILIIEDDASIRESLLELFESEGYDIIQAEHGERGLQVLADKTQVNLILLDLSMPVMDGKTFLKEIRSRFPELNSLPVIIMTAAGVGEIPKEHDRKMVLRKPLDIDELLTKVESFI